MRQGDALLIAMALTCAALSATFADTTCLRVPALRGYTCNGSLYCLTGSTQRDAKPSPFWQFPELRRSAGRAASLRGRTARGLALNMPGTRPNLEARREQLAAKYEPEVSDPPRPSSTVSRRRSMQ